MNTQTSSDTLENANPNSLLTAGFSPTTEPQDQSTAQRKSFQERVHDFEHEIIAEALEETGGKVTRAAKNLGLTHQGLCYIINHRHKELLPARTPVRIRRKSIIGKRKLRRAVSDDDLLFVFTQPSVALRRRSGITSQVWSLRDLLTA